LNGNQEDNCKEEGSAEDEQGSGEAGRAQEGRQKDPPQGCSEGAHPEEVSSSPARSQVCAEAWAEVTYCQDFCASAYIPT
jgi:hypothetical protein